MTLYIVRGEYNSNGSFLETMVEANDAQTAYNKAVDEFDNHPLWNKSEHRKAEVLIAVGGT